MEFRWRLTTIIAISLAIIAIIGGITIYLGLDISKRVNKISGLRQDIALRNKLIGSLTTLRKDSEKAKIYFSQIDSIFPTRDQLVNFSKDMAIVAGQSKISINSTIGNESKETGTDLVKVDFALNGSGPLDDIIAALKIIKNSRYPLDVKNIDLIKQDKDNISNFFNLSVSGEVFAFQDNND